MSETAGSMGFVSFRGNPSNSFAPTKKNTLLDDLSDEVKEAVNNAAQKQIEKMILDKPVVWGAECRTYDKYTSCIITWGKVESATSYKVEIVKSDGTKETYTVKGNWLYANSRYDKFIDEGMNGATVRVRAFGEDETYSPWSDVVEISDIWQ